MEDHHENHVRVVQSNVNQLNVTSVARPEESNPIIFDAVPVCPEDVQDKLVSPA